MLRSSFYNSIMFIVLALSYNIFKGILPTAALARRACAKKLNNFLFYDFEHVYWRSTKSYFYSNSLQICKQTNKSKQN